MTTPEHQDIVDTIKQIIDSTLEGEITWLRSNPTTYQWRQALGSKEIAVVSIQKIVKKETVRSTGRLTTKHVTNYVFQAINGATKTQMISISTDELPEFKEILDELYKAASANITRKGIEFLRRALKGEVE